MGLGDIAYYKMWGAIQISMIMCVRVFYLLCMKMFINFSVLFVYMGICALHVFSLSCNALLVSESAL